MNIEKEFIKEAIRAVYKESLLKENKKLEKMSLEALDAANLTMVEKSNMKKDLDNISNKYRQTQYDCYIDGAVDSQSVNFRAGIGFVIYTDKTTFYKHRYELAEEYSFNEVTQKTSSHIAEYQALISLLRVMSEQVLRPENARLTVYSDSEILVGQFSGDFRVTNTIQKELKRKTFDLCKRFKSVELEWIPRERNIVANQLAQQSLVTD